jgi:glycosyltransferase involved in cell wall biosynthesis
MESGVLCSAIEFHRQIESLRPPSARKEPMEPWIAQRRDDWAVIGVSDAAQRQPKKPLALRAETFSGAVGALSVSVLIPVHNEAESLPILVPQLLLVLQRLALPFEIIAVDDGSSDGSADVLTSLAHAMDELKVIILRRNYGQTAALMAGIDHASGAVIVPIDGDLQNDPEDIPALLNLISKGYDVVSGWRRDRKDSALLRVVPSFVANRLISWISGVKLNDYGCTLKAYRRDALEGMRLYGEMHRFIPIYASWNGAKVTQLPVNHKPRRFGHSKYGLGRTLKVILDLIVVKFLDRFFVTPIYLFGGFGLISLFLSLVSLSIMFYLKWGHQISMISTPLPLVTVMTFLVGMMSILMGLIAEMLVRTYFESQHRVTYQIRTALNFMKEPS